ncbi:hypothetical protein MMC13_000112 [Lambiella insularis]|nr:hypothetical protein [Lambiella insularis]
MAKAAMTGVHTAGIYADMTVDGPDIGTLVVIVDRARNLPNRKTMGKQDPYCAARLGKEAKRTETDKRGGQTPRWDQELRFTVHDSLDYHQLKVSIFNEDKRTDLIGETWVPLDKVVVPGGGQSDTWHSLNCKGRYAGEIRIELTYYDTRPKEQRSRAPSEASHTFDGQERGIENVAGPRRPHPKPVKRRPLPADPTLSDPSPRRPIMPDHAQSSPLPYAPPGHYESRPAMLTTPHSVHGSTYLDDVDHQPQHIEDYETEAQPYHPQDNQNTFEETLYPNQSPEVPSAYLVQQSSLIHEHYPPHHVYPPNHDGSSSGNQIQVPYPTDFEDSQLYPSPRSQGVQNHDLDLPELPAYNPSLIRPIPRNPRDQKPSNGSLSSPVPSLNHNRSIPELNQRSQPRMDEVRPSGTSHHHNKSYQQSPLRHRSHENRYNTQSSPMQQAAVENGLPPPPPVHRNSGLNSPSEAVHRTSLPAVSAPAPLNVRHGRNSISASPLSQSYTDAPREDYVLSTSPDTTQLSTFSAPPLSAYENYNPRSRDFPSFNQYGQPTPPSLVAGYDPTDAEPESRRIMGQQQPHTPQSYGRMPSLDDSVSQRNQFTGHHRSYNHTEVPRRNEEFRNRAEHRSSVPLVKPRGVSPDPRTPTRKSVSPHPQSAPREGTISSVPFSPDSYEALNPNLKSASNVNKSGPSYKTPEEARDAFRQKEQEEKLEEGPIIGSDGRIIDPSDHLPTETWAPEPEQKNPRKGPEITFRFRQSPLGAQPMPNSAPRPPRETVIRPHSIATSSHSYSADATSPSMAGRNRLQKKTRLSPTHANSSPVLTINNNNNGTSPSTYPLREHVNYGLSGSPGYSRSSPSAPPPVPAKVPLAAGQEDWGADALSEEMRRIDIGIGASTGRARRSRYGP